MKSPREFCRQILFVNKPAHWEDKRDLLKVIANTRALETLSDAPCLAVDSKQVVSFPFLSL